MSVQSDKLAAEIRRAVQAVLGRGLNDPRIRGIVSVTRVEVSDGGGDATVFISVLPEVLAELTIHGIQHANKHIRSQVGKLVRVRRLPRLHFKSDQSLKKQSAVLSAIARANDEAPDLDDAGGEQSKEMDS